MKVLIVEDEEKLARSLKRGLEQEGYAVDYVLDGETGERRIVLYSKDYDVIILDLGLPGKDGFEICRSVRAQGITTPILILTGRDATDDKIAALDGGADDYLMKPFEFQELLARLRALLRRPTQALPVELKIRDLALNTVTRKVSRDGKEVPLTLKEFTLLEYMMRHPNQVLTREQILSNVWDFTFDSFSNVVDVHIMNLRNKVDDKPYHKLLETVRGVGYRINA